MLFVLTTHVSLCWWSQIQELQRSLLESQTQQQVLVQEAELKAEQIKALQEEVMVCVRACVRVCMHMCVQDTGKQ